MCEKLGWKGKRTPYDVLPLVIQLEGESPRIFEIPKKLVKEVTITHPQLDGFDELDVKWYAVSNYLGYAVGDWRDSLSDGSV